MNARTAILREPVEIRYAAELERLARDDPYPKPAGWRVSPRAVRAFVIGDERRKIARKFYGDDPLIDRCVVTLMSNRALLLVGEPGTAKSMLSELFAAAISGDSTRTIQGTGGTTEDQIKYSWNYALLLADGPTPRALVPAPLYDAMKSGTLVRFEEITRVQPEVQDSLISILSDKVVHVPELIGEESAIFARPGFNMVATANLRDRGVHEMSSALKRRFNFETVRPIADRTLEKRLVREQTQALLDAAKVDVTVGQDVTDLLVTAFVDLRSGTTEDGTVIERPTAVMSTAEAVAVGFAACLDAHYFGDGTVDGGHVARHLIGTVLKDNPDDAKRLRHWFDVAVKPRAKRDRRWQPVLAARSEFDW